MINVFQFFIMKLFFQSQFQKKKMNTLYLGNITSIRTEGRFWGFIKLKSKQGNY